MIANTNPEIDQTASSIWQLTEDEKIREQIRRRNANEHMYQHIIDLHVEEARVEMQKKLDAKNLELNTKDQQLSVKDEQLREKNQYIQELEQQIKELRKN